MIETQRLYLRHFVMQDEDDCFEFLSDEQTCLDDGGYHAFISQDKNYKQLMKKFESQQNRMMIVTKENSKVIGTIHLFEDERDAQTVRIGYLIAPAYRRQGYAYEALSAMIHQLFETDNIRMLTATCFIHNTASALLLEKLGFKKEGILHKAMKHAVLGEVDAASYYMEK